MKRYLLLLLLALCPVARAQWTTVATYKQPVIVTVGTLFRWGSATDNLWSPYKMASQPTLSFTVGGGEFPVNPDPQQPISALVLQVYQIPIAQNITVAGTVVPIPAMDATKSVTPQPGTPDYCNSGKAMVAAVNVVISAATGTITSGSMPCN